MEGLHAGVARATLRPEPRAYLIGYGSRWRGSTGVRDDLSVTALALEERRTGAPPARALLLAFDLLCLHEDVVARIRRAAEPLGVRPEAVMVACSHTHAAPVAYPGPAWSRRRRRWIDGVVAAAADAARRAQAALAPALLAGGTGEARVGSNRRERRPDGTIAIGVSPEGFVDRSVGVVELRAPDGGVRATLVAFACHGTVLGPENREVSADWPGVLRREVERATGAPCLFLQGATANVNPLGAPSSGAAGDEALERVGCAVAEAVRAARARGLAPCAGTPLRAVREEVPLPVALRRDASGRREPWHVTAARRLRMPPAVVRPFVAYAYPWRPRVREVGHETAVFPMEIQVLRAGDLAVVGFAAEVFAEIGAVVKSGSPVPWTLFAAYANGCTGYVTTAAARAEGGYEVDEAPLAYRMGGTFDAATEPLVTSRAAALLSETVS